MLNHISMIYSPYKLGHLETTGKMERETKHRSTQNKNSRWSSSLVRKEHSMNVNKHLWSWVMVLLMEGYDRLLLQHTRYLVMMRINSTCWSAQNAGETTKDCSTS